MLVCWDIATGHELWELGRSGACVGLFTRTCIAAGTGLRRLGVNAMVVE